MELPQTVITRQMVLAELIKAGINRDIADDLSYRYYKNELTHKDIEYLKENFDIKLEKVQDNLNNKIDNVRNELKSDIKALDNKIDNVKTELKADIASVSSEVALVRKDMDLLRKDMTFVKKDIEMNKLDINSQLVDIISELKSSSKLNCWMFGTIITLFIGVLLTLIPIVY